MAYLWDKNKISPAGRAGLGVAIRLAEKVFFNIEANANVMSDKFNSKKAGNADWQFNALAGFTFKFGKPSRTTEPVYYEPTPTPPPAPAPVKEEPAPAPVVEEVKPMTQNVFFEINSAEIRTSEENKIASLVSYLKEHSNAKVSLCGYADKQTGNARINERLSKERAEAVAEALKAQGIAESRITVDYKGDTAQPFGTAEENRVTIFFCLNSTLWESHLEENRSETGAYHCIWTIVSTENAKGNTWESFWTPLPTNTPVPPTVPNSNWHKYYAHKKKSNT